MEMKEKRLVNRKCATMVIAAVLLAAVLLVDAAGVEAVNQQVIIHSDGTVTPATVPIRRNGDIYTLTDNIFVGISVQRSNITIDGAGYTLQGPYNGTSESAFFIGGGPNQVPEGVKVPYPIGIDLAFPQVAGLTVKNLNIKNFSIGMYIWTENNKIVGNAITETIVGILLSGSDNQITHNYVAGNKQGIFFGWNEPGEIPTTIEISHNWFDSNEQHLSGCLCEDYNLTELPHTWDDGREGNYWADYNGSDGDGDGIGDTPYVIDALNRDRYPLMKSPVSLPTVSEEFPITLAAVAVLLLVLTAAVVLFRKRKMTPKAA